MKYILTMKADFGIIDIIAYAGGIWFFISQLTLGPLVKFFVSRKLFIAEIGEKLFYKMQDSKFEQIKGQRARIDINSAPELKKKALEQELVQVPRVFINDNGEII